MKRNPGEWLRERLLERLLDVATLACAGVGWLCGGCLALWLTLGAGVEAAWAIGFVLLPGVGLLVVASYKYKSKSRWRLADMEKGACAEKTVGQAIEYALTRGSCAVAHHVEQIARVGDIDHLVATPDRLWVIETKYGRVPPAEFPEVLRRIARNVEGVRDWAPGTRVTGCLVFGSQQDKQPRPTYTNGRETIRAFADPTALMRELRKEAQKDAGSQGLAREVWKLGTQG